MEDSRGALRRNRRLVGTLERLRCGWARQDREGGVWACPAAADGMVPAGARQIDWIAGDPGAAGCAQAASRKVAGRGIEHSGNPAWFRPEGRPGDPQDV